MFPIAHGIDSVEIERIERLLSEHPQRFRERCFTALERRLGAEGGDRPEFFAGRFAVKEAVFKALGTGWAGGVGWTDIEVARLPAGGPGLSLHGAAMARAAELGIDRWLVSLTHTSAAATASVIALSSVG